MKEQYVRRLMSAVGCGVFVRHFRAFADDTLSNQQVAELLPNTFTSKSRRSRTSHARSIFRQGLAPEVLHRIVESRRLDDDTIRKARVLLEEVQG